MHLNVIERILSDGIEGFIGHLELSGGYATACLLQKGGNPNTHRSVDIDLKLVISIPLQYREKENQN